GGSGLNFVIIGSELYDSGGTSRRRVSWFRAMCTAGIADITVNFSSQYQDEIAILVDEISNVSTSGSEGSEARAQAITSVDTSGTNTSMNISLSPFASPQNATYGSFGSNGSGTTTAGSGFLKINEETSNSDPIVRSTSEFVGANNTTVGMTFSSATEI